jgi:hypothetical protein
MTRADLHRLVDELPDASLEAAAVLLLRAQDPVIARLDAAPWDDEPYTDEERAEDEVALAAYQRGEGIPLEDLMAELDADDAAVG